MTVTSNTSKGEVTVTEVHHLTEADNIDPVFGYRYYTCDVCGPNLTFTGTYDHRDHLNKKAERKRNPHVRP